MKNMTAVRDDLAKLAYALAGDLPKKDRDSLLAVFARDKDLSEDRAFALFVRGKNRGWIGYDREVSKQAAACWRLDAWAKDYFARLDAVEALG